MGMTWSEYKAYREKKKKEEEQTKKQQKASSSKTEKTITNNANNQEKNNNLINTISQNNRLPLNNENANKIASNTPSLQDIVSKNNSSKIVQTNNNPLAKKIEEQNANKPLQKAIEEQKKKPKTTQKEPSTWERIMDNFRIGGYGGITGVAQTGYRDIRDIDNMYTDASSSLRHQVLSTFFGEHGENFARAVDDKLYKWNNDRNQVYNYALDVLNKEQQKNKQNIQQNIEAVKQSGDKVGTKFAELAPSVGNNAMGLLAGTVNPALAFTYYKGSSEASYYDDALQRGMTEDQAKVYSKLMSYVEAGTETISAGNILKGGKAIKAVASGAKNIGVKEGLKAGFNVFKESAKEETANALKQGLKSYGIGIAEEFFQEAITEPIQEFTAMKVAGEDKADWNNMWQRMLQSGVDGALSSAILAGANMGISSCQGIVTKVQNGQEFTTEEYNTAIKDASEKVDVGKMTTDGIKNQVEKLKTEMQQSQNGVNKDINQENKMPQNQFSQADTTETLRQEARDKLESIKQNYDENSYNQMQEFIETAPNEKALNQVISDLNKEAETKQVAPLKQKQEVQIPLKQETQNKSFEDVAFEAMNNYESNEVESPLKNRDMDSIGKQTKVNAYQYDNPKVKPYFQEMAQQMGEDLAYISSSDNRSTQKGGGTKLSATTKAMDILHNEQGYSYDQIAKGLQNIIDDKGSENNAISKKIELVIDEQLRNGYTNALGKNITPNQEYIDTVLNQTTKVNQNILNDKTTNNLKKSNIINEKVNEYIDTVRDDFKSDIDIKTQSINEGDMVPFDYNKAGQSALSKKAKSLVDRLKTRVFKNNNEDIHVSNGDIRKSISETLKNQEQNKYKKENVAVFSQLDKVIENAKLLDIADEHKGRDYYSDYKYYVSNVYIDGNPFVVEFDTRMQDSGNGTMERHFRLERVYPLNNNEVVSNTVPKVNSDNTFLNETTSINNSISQNEQNVKSDSTNINNMQNNQENIQETQNNNTKGEIIKWNEIEKPEDDRKIRKHYKSIIESDNTTAEAKSIAKDLMGTDTYVPETNKGQLAQADQRIMTSSPEVELQSLLSRAMNGEKISSVDIAVGERLIQYFSKTGSKQQLQEAIQATAMAGTSAGQTVQALSMLNHQTPQGQATWIQRSVDKMNKELAKKKGGTITTDADGNLQVINKQGKDITNKVDLFNLTPEMIDKIMNSENQEQMYKNIDEVYEELGQQVPKSMIEKIDTWRYFSMLANARTHIRNMVGNVAMGKMQRVKDKIAGGIEGVVSQFNPNMERTKTLARADKKTKNFAKQDFKNMEVQSRLELNENKYNPQSRLQNARRTFKSDVMENTLGRLFNLNDTLLEAEDGLGLKAGYQKALADYITANKIDVDNITDKQLNKARNYAIQQAKEATFHQANAIASAVAQFENKNLATKLFTGAVLPFKKTPMNVAKAGMEYSPLQIAKSATVDLVNLRKGNISVNQYIDNLSKGMTGTGIALVGYALANAGILKASGGDDKDKEKYEEEQGKQSYSIQIAGKTYSLDWLAPTGIPLFIGAETHKLFNQEETEKSTEKKSEEDRLNQAIKGASNLLNAGATAINPMSEMSMISGLTSALSSYNTSDNLGSLGNMMTNMGKSYVNQFFPTLMGQVAKTGDEYERTTKSTAKGTIGKAVDQTINQIKNKVPGLRQTLPIKTDIWGKEVKQEVNLPLRAVNNFINPATVKEVSTDKVDMELNKLYEENRNSALLPDILTKTVQLNKQTYRLSNKEYAVFTKNYGQTSHKLIENFIKTSDYNRLTQEQKETAISNIYSYAKEQNKLDYAKKVNEEVKPSTLYTTMKEIEKGGGKQSEYLNYLAKTKGISKENEKNKVLADSNYSNKTKEIIYTNGAGKDDNLYNDLLSKSNIDMTEYLKYKDKLSSKAFSADRDKDGKTVAGSAKTKVINYLNNNITGVGNRLLIAGKSYALQNSEKQKLAEYINSTVSTREERLDIYKQLDKNFTIKDGKVYMRVSKR